MFAHGSLQNYTIQDVTLLDAEPYIEVVEHVFVLRFFETAMYNK